MNKSEMMRQRVRDAHENQPVLQELKSLRSQAEAIQSSLAEIEKSAAKTEPILTTVLESKTETAEAQAMLAMLPEQLQAMGEITLRLRELQNFTQQLPTAIRSELAPLKQIHNNYKSLREASVALLTQLNDLSAAAAVQARASETNARRQAIFYPAIAAMIVLVIVGMALTRSSQPAIVAESTEAILLQNLALKERIRGDQEKHAAALTSTTKQARSALALQEHLKKELLAIAPQDRAKVLKLLKLQETTAR